MSATHSELTRSYALLWEGLSFSSAQTARLQQYLAFITERIIPLEPLFLQNGFGHVSAELEMLRKQAKQESLWTPYLSADGKTASLAEFGPLSEVMGLSPLGHFVFNCQAPDIGNIELLQHHASADIKERYLEPLKAGTIRSCFSMTEPTHAGSNPVMMDTTARKDGGEWVIDGHKWFTTAAEGASFSVVMALTAPEHPNPYQRASMIIVPTDTPGFQIVRNIRIMGEEGEGYMTHAEVRFENCRVPLANLVGAEGTGFRLAQERLGPGRIHHCMRWIGIAERALHLMCQRAVSRRISQHRTLADRQAVQHWAAEVKANIQAARLMVLHTAKMIDEKGAKNARTDISMIKFFVSNILQQTIDRAVQVHGALGVTDDTVLSFWYRHERGARIYDGADEVHKSATARDIFRLYGKDDIEIF